MMKGQTAALARTAAGYTATVLPLATRELSRWRRRALEIPDPVLRAHALRALGKRGNMHGAALLAVFAPAEERRRVVRALVALQSAYNYLDLLAEQPSDDPVGNGERLHEALLEALDGPARGDRYALHERRGDGGYLSEVATACREAARQLPSFGLVRDSALAAARRIVSFQSLNLGVAQGSIDGLRCWGELNTPQDSDLAWWETAAAAGSSLGVHVLLGLAADRALDASTVTAVDGAYFPWIGALHSLLDSAVDGAEDAREGQRNLLSHYPSERRAVERLGHLTELARASAATLPDAQLHEVVLAAMTSHYLSSPLLAGAQGEAIAASVISASGPLGAIALRAVRAGQRVSGGALAA
jgi:tetraprenyl-beta-curcumene synthase